MIVAESERLRIRGLSMTFPGGVVALRDVEFAARGGEFVAVLGRNGCGKSTLLRCIARLLTPTAGSIAIDGRDIAHLAGDDLRGARCAVAFVTQQANLVRRRSVLANVAMGTLGRHRSLASQLGRLPPEEIPVALDSLQTVGLDDRAAQRAGTLSGGQAQRASIARALAQRPAILLADEPVASLDPDAANDVLRLLRQLADDGLCVVCVLHQPDLAQRFADRVVGMRAGAIAFDAPAAAVTSAQLGALYAGRQVAAV